MTLLTFNIRTGYADDGEHSWPNRRDALFSLLRTVDADLVGLQEATAFQLADILAACPRYRSIGVAGQDGVEEGEFCAILYDPSALELRESGTFWLSPTPGIPSDHPDAACRRICTWGRFFDGTAEFLYPNTHLDHISQPARYDGVRQVVALGANLVTGDFNAGESAPEVSLMREAGYQDSYRHVYPEGEAKTFHAFTGIYKPDKLDYIWIDSGWEVEEARILDEQMEGVWPSDHAAVTATLRRR